MNILVSGSLVIVSATIPYYQSLSSCVPHNTLKEYVSPTMNLDPWENYNEKLMQQIFVDELKQYEP